MAPAAASALPPLEVGQRVKARWQQGADWYPGRVSAVRAEAPHGAALFDVAYDDGDEEKMKPIKRVRAIDPDSSSDEDEDED